MKTAIVTDSNSGIFSEEAEKTGIFVVPMPVIIDNNSFYEGVDIRQAEFLKAQSSEKMVTSSQPSPSTVLDIWNDVLKEYDELVYIPMSSGLSGSCGTAKMLSEEYNGKVQVVDNHRISVTLRSSVNNAILLSKMGKNACQIKEILEQDAYNASIYVAVDTLEYLKKGGRVTPAGASIANVLNIKPVLTIQGGKLDAFAKVRGMKKAEKIMIDAVKNDIKTRFSDISDNELFIGAAGSFVDKEDECEWKDMVQEAFAGAEIIYNALPLSITCHVGPNAMGIGVALNNLHISAKNNLKAHF